MKTSAAEYEYLVRSRVNAMLLLCTDGEFHARSQCGPGGFCAKVYKTEANARRHNPNATIEANCHRASSYSAKEQAQIARDEAQASASQLTSTSAWMLGCECNNAEGEAYQMATCSVDGCERSDLAHHPRGGFRDTCEAHTDGYLECWCCSCAYISSVADTARTEPSAVDMQENGPDFSGYPLCPECTDHDLFSCRDDEDGPW